MLTRPTTDQLLVGIAAELRNSVSAEVTAEPVKIVLGMIDQMLASAARRAAHEIAWMHEEVAQITALTGKDFGSPTSLHLDDVAAWYDTASRALSEAIESAYASADADRIAAARAVLDARSAHEQEILGSLQLVGRG